MEPDIVLDDSYNKLLASLTWKDVLARYVAASERIKQHCDLQSTTEPISIELARSIGGLVTIYSGLRRVIVDQSRHDQPASPEMAECVLSLAGRILRDLPEVTAAGAA